MSSNSNTGIGFVDNAVDFTVNGAADLGKNIERNAQNVSQGIALMASGDFNNAGRTLIDATSFMMGGGLINPDDVKNVTGMETAVERKTREGKEAIAAKEITDAQNVLDEQRRVAEAQVQGMVDTKKRTPGRSQTLITAPAASNTLLTLMNRS